MLHTQARDTHRAGEPLSVSPMSGEDGARYDVPRNWLPDGPMRADTAFRLVHDHLMLDGNARLNLAAFVTTWMEPQAERLMTESLPKNMIDKDEYPQTAELENRCVNMLARLWNAPE